MNADERYTGASQQAIQSHYDLGNAFYALWLDPTLSYSCALYAPGEGADALDVAQQRKIHYHLQGIEITGCSRILDIGCGWGALLSAARELNPKLQAIGLTLSNAQQAYIQSRDPTIDVRVENWFDHCPQAPYDGIISVGAFEHFASPDMTREAKLAAYDAFFRRCHDWLDAGHLLSLQTITYGGLKPGELAPMISARIFPESDLPQLSEVVSAAEPYFELIALVNGGEDYVRTNKAWLGRLRDRQAEAEAMVGQRRTRDYIEYLSHSLVGFATGGLNLYRLRLKRRRAKGSVAN